jgi:hypothetical protein
MTSRRSRRDHEAAVTDKLPDVVDLLVLTTAAGLPIGSALRDRAPARGPSRGRPRAGGHAC